MIKRACLVFRISISSSCWRTTVVGIDEVDTARNQPVKVLDSSREACGRDSLSLHAGAQQRGPGRPQAEAAAPAAAVGGGQPCCRGLGAPVHSSALPACLTCRAVLMGGRNDPASFAISWRRNASGGIAQLCSTARPRFCLLATVILTSCFARSKVTDCSLRTNQSLCQWR